MKKMTPEKYEQLVKFRNARRTFALERTPEEQEYWMEQVRQRVIAFLDVLGYDDLKLRLTEAFWGERQEYSDVKATRQAMHLNCREMDIYNGNPYFWYCLIKPFARELRKATQAFTAFFDKLPQESK